MKSSTKAVLGDCYWVVSTMSFIINMNKSYEDVMSHCSQYDETIRKIVWFPNMHFSSYSFYRAFDGASSREKIKELSFSSVEIFAKWKSFLNIFTILNIVPDTIIILLVFFGNTDAKRTSQKQSLYTVFVELFTTHLLEKKSRLYDLPMMRYLQSTRCCNHYAALGIFSFILR